MSNSRVCEIKVIYDDVDITKDIQPMIESFSYTDKTKNTECDDMSIVLNNSSGLWSSSWMPSAGVKFQALITCRNWFNQGDNFVRDCGVFEIDSINEAGLPSVFNISCLSIGITNKINAQENSQTWENKDFKGIAEELVSRNGFEFMYCSDYNPIVGRWEQVQESDISVLKKICEYAGFLIKITGEMIILFRAEEFDKREPEITIKKSEVSKDNGYSFSMNTSDVYSAVEVKYYDSQKKEMVEYLYYPDGISGIRGFSKEEKEKPEATRTIDQDTRMEIIIEAPEQEDEELPEIKDPEVGKVLRINQRVESIEDAEHLAKSLLRERNKRQLTATLNSIGRPDLYSGITVKLEGFGIWDTANWYIEQVSHEKSASSGYTSSIELRGTVGF